MANRQIDFYFIEELAKRVLFNTCLENVRSLKFVVLQMISINTMFCTMKSFTIHGYGMEFDAVGGRNKNYIYVCKYLLLCISLILCASTKFPPDVFPTAVLIITYNEIIS